MKKKIQLIIGILVGVGLMAFLFYLTDWKKVLDAVRAASPFWVFLSFLAVLPVAYTRTMRWAYIIRSSQWVPLRPIFSASQIGFLAILTLPARLGEIVRVLVLGRLAKLPFSKCMAAAALDRVSDFVSLLVIVGITLVAYHPTEGVRLPAHLLGMKSDVTVSVDAIRYSEITLAVSVLVLGAVLVGVYLRPALVLRLSDFFAGLISKRLAKSLHSFIQHFIDGLTILNSPVDMAKAIFFSLATWAFYLSVITFAMIAFDIHFPWYAPLFIETCVAAMISMPLAPGAVGQFHIGVVAGMMILMPGTDIAKAFAVSLVAHVINLLGVFLPGIFCLFWEQFGLIELSRESESIKAGKTAE